MHLLHFFIRFKGRGILVLLIMILSITFVLLLGKASIYLFGLEQDKYTFNALFGVGLCLAGIINSLVIRGYFHDKWKYMRYEENDEYIYLKVSRWTWILLVWGALTISLQFVHST
ncbi:MAG: hypothetical protein JWO03_1428 [Bacteroidetes bacterium]|nr:hypothetical protein [Bacteroidota bacterium]